jgi:hypothetical protein
LFPFVNMALTSNCIRKLHLTASGRPWPITAFPHNPAAGSSPLPSTG